MHFKSKLKADTFNLDVNEYYIYKRDLLEKGNIF